MSELNDPRVLFAAERTLLAWNRTSLALIAFGFVIERSGLFLQLLTTQHAGAAASYRDSSFWIGVAFILIGAFFAVAATFQYRKVLRGLKPVEIPEGYRVHLGVFANLAIAALGIATTLYMLLRGQGA